LHGFKLAYKTLNQNIIEIIKGSNDETNDDNNTYDNDRTDDNNTTDKAEPYINAPSMLPTSPQDPSP